MNRTDGPVPRIPPFGGIGAAIASVRSHHGLPNGGMAINNKECIVHNLINKFEAEVSQTDDAGIVAIEYVVMAGVIIVAVGALAWTGAFGALTTKLTSLIGGIN